MDSFTLKKSFILVMLLLLCGMTLKAANNPQVVVKLDKPGSLSSKVSFSTTNLKVIGSLDGKDMYCLREMAGCDRLGEATKGKLATLDLSEANILTGNLIYLSMLGGEPYFNGHKWVDLTHNVKDGICQFEFSDCNALKKIILPSSLKSIGRYAFKDCTNLQSVEFSSDSIYMENSVFCGCTRLYEVKLPEKLVKIPNSTFYGCKNLQNCEIPSGVNEIDSAAFSGCAALKEITIPSTVTKIGAWAFESCGLHNVELPSGLLEIEYETFYDCEKLLKVVLPSQLKKIDDRAFVQCFCLQHLEFPNTLQEIGEDTFLNDSWLSKVNFPLSLLKIGAGAFQNSGLIELKLPKSLIYIGCSAFRNCKDLSSVYVLWDQLPMNENIRVADVFDEVPMEKCMLYVPKGMAAEYKNSSNWSYFKNIVEFDATGIDKVTISADAKEMSRYSVNGQRLSAPTKGLNIVKYSDGSVKKVAVQ